MPRCVLNRVTKLELRRDSRREKLLHMIVVFWLCLLHVGAQDITEMCH